VIKLNAAKLGILSASVFCAVAVLILLWCFIEAKNANGEQ
jgi:hypothetical protein